jgi:hypothetical protein
MFPSIHLKFRNLPNNVSRFSFTHSNKEYVMDMPRYCSISPKKKTKKTIALTFIHSDKELGLKLNKSILCEKVK